MKAIVLTKYGTPDDLELKEVEKPAAIPHAAMLAQQSLRDISHITEGQTLLINGAGGGVGTLGLQLAKLNDLEVTGVDSTAKQDFLRSRGFDHVIDYSQDDFTKTGLSYDVILDVKTNRSPFAYARALKAKQPTSKWSDINRMRWMALKEAGLLTAAGLAAAPTDNSYTSRPPIPDLPSYIARALKQNPKAWQFFQSLAPTYRRHFVGWIHSAKRQETRGKRIRESVELLTAGKKLGLK